MEFQYFGGNAVSMTVKGRKFYFDGWMSSDLNKKSIIKEEDVVLLTQRTDLKSSSKLIFDSPGEYEVSDVSITGIQAKSFKESGSDITMFKITTNEISALITGSVNPDISESMLEKIGMIDVLIVPAGGFGETLNPNDAMKVVKSIEPKIFIPTYYKTESENLYSIDEIVSQLGMEISEKTNKYKVKLNELTDKTQLVVIEK